MLCERCGFPFRSQFTKKDYKEMGSPPIQAPKLKRKQTVAYTKSKKQGVSRTSKKSKSTPKPTQTYRYVPPPKPEKRKGKHGIKVETSGIKQRIPDREIDNLKKAIRIMNDIVGSPLLIIIGLLILGGTIPGSIISIRSGLNTEIYRGIMNLVLNSYRFSMIILDYKIIISMNVTKYNMLRIKSLI